MIEWEIVDSTCLDKIGYDPVTNTLGCDFCFRGVYAYLNVTYDIFIAFLNAASHGHYFNDNVRNAGYGYDKIGH
jgi:hypothetical protein